MAEVDGRLRVKVVLLRLWQPTSACITCMTAPSFANLASVPHWLIALKTGLGTGALALLLTFTPAGRLFTHRWGNALLVGVLTALADAWSHRGRFENAWAEPALTGLAAAAIALVTSYLVEWVVARRRRHDRR